VAVHLSLLISCWTGWYTRFTFDSVATHGDRAWDFNAVYQAGHNVLTGRSVYESDNDKIDVVVLRYTPYRYLPFLAMVLGVPFNMLDPVAAYTAWVFIIEVTLLVSAGYAWRLADDPNHGVVLASMWLLATPFYLEVYLGQFNLVQAALVWALLLTSQHGLTWRGDVWWVLSLLWKQNTGLLAPVYMREKRWRSLMLAAMVVLAMSLPYWLAVPGSFADFMRNLYSSQPTHQLGNLGARQWLYSLTSWLAPGLSGAAHVWIGRGWVALIISVTALTTWKAPRAQAAELLCLWMSSYLLVYHDVWEHHYLLTLPVCVWLYHRERSPWVLACWALLALWTPYILIDPAGAAGWQESMRWMPLTPRWLDTVYHSSKAIPALALWGWQVYRLVRQEPCLTDCGTS